MFELMDKLQGRRKLAPTWADEKVTVTCDELRKAINKFPKPSAESVRRGELTNRRGGIDGQGKPLHRGRYRKPDGTYSGGNSYPPDFKEKVMAEIRRPLPNYSYIAKEFNISYRTVLRWSKEPDPGIAADIADIEEELEKETGNGKDKTQPQDSQAVV